MMATLGKEQLDALSKKYGDAFYLLESEKFENNYVELEDSFRAYYQKFKIAYSYKTNYTPKLVQIVDRLGGYAEVVSEMEMEVALKSKVAPSRIIWNGPIKNFDKVEELLLSGGEVNIDSTNEMEYVRKIALKHPNSKVKIGIRCNYDIGDGVLSRFGIDVDGKDFEYVLDTIRSTPNIQLIALHSHFAKRNPELWVARTEGMLRLYDYVVERYDLNPEILDMGGGIFGKMPEELCTQLGVNKTTYNDYAIIVAKMFAEHFKNYQEPPFLFIEPGTALAGDCMRFVCRVETIKEIRGKTIITVCGSQKNINMVGINAPMEIISGGKEPKEYIDADIVGYTCIEGDVLQKNYSGRMAVGDYVIFDNCGSYSIVMKAPFIFPNVPMIDLNDVSGKLAKREESFDDIFCTYNF